MKKRIVVVTLLMMLPVLARADSVTFNETSPNTVPDIASATFSIGGADTGKCATCFFVTSPNLAISTFGPVTIVSDGLFFDASTHDLGGSMSFTFLGAGGGTHHDTLTFTDGTPDFQLMDVNGRGVTKLFSGNYSLTTTAVATPEPNSLRFLGMGLLALVPLLRRASRRRCSGPRLRRRSPSA